MTLDKTIQGLTSQLLLLRVRLSHDPQPRWAKLLPDTVASPLGSSWRTTTTSLASLSNLHGVRPSAQCDPHLKIKCTGTFLFIFRSANLAWQQRQQQTVFLIQKAPGLLEFFRPFLLFR